MFPVITISPETIFHQAKLTCQLPNLIEGIVTQQIITQAAEEDGIEVEPHELQEAADQFRLQHNLESVEDTMAWLEHHHLSMDEFEEIIHTNLLTSKLARHLFSDQLEPLFAAHQTDYLSAAVYEVILDDEDLAMELFYALQEGEISFWEIANHYIEDIELRRRGGYLGVVKRNDMRPEISARVFAAETPQLLRPVITAQGVHMIKVEEIIQPQLDEQLHQELLSKLFQEWLDTQIMKTHTKSSSSPSLKA